MQRYKLTIEYDGTAYAGWQIQDIHQTVQGRLITAFRDFLKPQGRLSALEIENLDVMGSGRTDAGVHATGQVAHVDLPEYEPFHLRAGVNHFLKESGVIIVEVEKVSSDFHARFSATKRTYIYKLLNRRAPSPLDHNRAWHIGVPLDIDLMREGAKKLVGYHDFTSFRSARCQAKSPFKTLDLIDIRKELETQMIFFKLEARSFLHNQVRAIVGTLKLVGEGRLPPEKIDMILKARDRRNAGPNAVPYGLYLAQVSYDMEKGN